MRLDATMALGRRPERARRGNIDLLAPGGRDIPSPRPLLPILVAFPTNTVSKLARRGLPVAPGETPRAAQLMTVGLGQSILSTRKFEQNQGLPSVFMLQEWPGAKVLWRPMTKW